MLVSLIEIRDIIVAGQYTIADIALYACTQLPMKAVLIFLIIPTLTDGLSV
jgi:lipopolysaccharide export LptBFGC system permease protein LptF